jgi:hypothetical protein
MKYAHALPYYARQAIASLHLTEPGNLDEQNRLDIGYVLDAPEFLPAGCNRSTANDRTRNHAFGKYTSRDGE